VAQIETVFLETPKQPFGSPQQVLDVSHIGLGTSSGLVQLTGKTGHALEFGGVRLGSFGRFRNLTLQERKRLYLRGIRFRHFSQLDQLIWYMVKSFDARQIRPAKSEAFVHFPAQIESQLVQPRQRCVVIQDKGIQLIESAQEGPV
jgi:hypothetical protein